MSQKLYKFANVLWEVKMNPLEIGDPYYLHSQPRCSIDGCRVELRSQSNTEFICPICQKVYPCPDGWDINMTATLAEMKWKGDRLRDHEVISLDLPPTKVSAEDSDEHYWVRVRLGEKGGKRIGVVYVGEKIGKGQTKKDYAQAFIDIEDDQLRFDKSNRNPMRLLAKLTAEFPTNTTVIERKSKKDKEEK